MDSKPVQNMQSSTPKLIWEISASLVFIIRSDHECRVNDENHDNGY